jgi:hypothetical protein
MIASVQPLGLRAQKSEGALLFVRQLHHCAPVSVSRGGSSLQRGLASASTIPQPVHAIRGPKLGTGK